jgi:prepilin-type N-terminal cleavage/methylation domain-containing protein
MMLGIKHNRKMETKRSGTKKDDGFTLLEVIMAISILTIGLLAVASMQASAIRGNAISREYTEWKNSYLLISAQMNSAPVIIRKMN